MKYIVKKFPRSPISLRKCVGNLGYKGVRITVEGINSTSFISVHDPERIEQQVKGLFRSSDFDKLRSKERGVSISKIIKFCHAYHDELKQEGELLDPGLPLLSKETIQAWHSLSLPKISKISYYDDIIHDSKGTIIKHRYKTSNEL